MSKDVTKLTRDSARGSVILLIGQVITSLISTLTVIWMARFLGSTTYGLYSIALIPIGIALLFQDLGINSALTRFTALYRYEDRTDELRAIVITGLFFSIITSVVISAAMYFFAAPIASLYLKRPELTTLVQAASLAILGGGGLLTTIQAILIGYEKMAARSITQIVWSILRTVITATFLLMGMGAFGAVFANTLSQVIAGVFGLLLLFYLIRFKIERKMLNWKALKTMLSYGMPVSIGSIIGGLLGQFYSSLMVIYVATDLIGNYSAAVNFSIFITLLTIPISTSLFPLFSKFKGDDPRLHSIYRVAVKYTSMITVPIVLIIIALSNPLSQLVYGPDYPYVSLYLSIYITTYLWEGLGGLALNNTIRGIGATKVALMSSVCSFIVGSIAAYFIAPIYGMVGILVVIALDGRVGWLYLTIWAKKNIGLSIDWISSARVYFSGFVAFAVCYGFIHFASLDVLIELIIGAVLFGVTYLLGLLFSGALNKEDMEEFSLVIQGMGPLSKIIEIFLSIINRFVKK